MYYTGAKWSKLTQAEKDEFVALKRKYSSRNVAKGIQRGLTGLKVQLAEQGVINYRY